MASNRINTMRQPGTMVRTAKKSQVRNTKRLVEQVNDPAQRTRNAKVMAMNAAVLGLLSTRPHVHPYIQVSKI